MGSLLDLEDVVYGHPKAAAELSELHSELQKLREYKRKVRAAFCVLEDCALDRFNEKHFDKARIEIIGHD